MRKIKLEDYNFAVGTVKEKMAREEKRYDLFNQRIHFHLIFLTVTAALLTLLISNMTKVGIGSIFNFTTTNYHVLGIKIFLSIIILGILVLNIVAVIYLIFKILSALKPITWMYPDREVVSNALENGTLNAYKSYLSDLERSAISNRDGVNGKYDILDDINQWFIIFWKLYFIMVFVIIAINFVCNLHILQ